MKTISRRDALKQGGKTLAIAGAAIAAGPAIATPDGTAQAALGAATGGNDAKLEALEREHRALTERNARAIERHEEATARMPEWARFFPPLVDRTDPLWKGLEYVVNTRPLLDDVKFHNARHEDIVKPAAHAGIPSSRAEYQRRRAEGRARIRSWIARYRDQQAWRERVGLPDLGARWDALSTRIEAIEREILEIPATSLRGAAVKLKMWARLENQTGPFADFDWPDKFAVQALADLERLTGGAS